MAKYIFIILAVVAAVNGASDDVDYGLFDVIEETAETSPSELRTTVAKWNSGTVSSPDETFLRGIIFLYFFFEELRAE